MFGEGVLSHDYFVEPASSEELRQVQDHGVVARAQERGGVVVVYRGVSWPRARCEQLEPDDFRALRVASLKVIVFLSLEGRGGDFEGRLVGRVDFCWRLFFLSFFLSFFASTRMKDAREYITEG